MRVGYIGLFRGCAVISTDSIMLAIALLAKQNREKDERIAQLEGRVMALEGRVMALEERTGAHGIYIEKRCLIEALEKIDE